MEFLEIATEWKMEKKRYVKKSSYAAYALLVENHLMPEFGNKHQVSESDIQNFVLQKLDTGLSQKTVAERITEKILTFVETFINGTMGE